MTTHSFQTFRATDKDGVLNLINANSSVDMIFKDAGETLNYRIEESFAKGMPAVSLNIAPQQIVIDGEIHTSRDSFADFDIGRIGWGDGKTSDVMLIHLTRTEFVLINIAGDPVNVNTTAQLRNFVASLTSETAITSGNLAENQSFSFSRFTDHVSVSEDDSITGTNGDDQFFLGIGNDVITALGGQDVISGQGGDDTLFGGDDQDFLYGGSGDDHLYGGASGYETMFGSDRLFGGAGQDELYGGPELSELYGDGGHDSLYLLEGRGIAYGGGGKDRIYLDTELFGGVAEFNAYGGKGDDKIFGGNASDFLYGDDGNDLIKGGKRSDFIDGRVGNDRLFGGGQGDQIIGGAGDDIMYGQNGADYLYGGSGADAFYGGKGKDTASYDRDGGSITASLKDDSKNAGNAKGDTYQSIENLHGSNSHDHLTGDGGKNELDGYSGDDILFGGGGADNLLSSDGNSSLYGGKGNDELQAQGLGTNHYYGGAGKDTILDYSNGATVFGGSGNDYIQTGAGRDIIYGGAGEDEIYSGLGNDTVAGGAGADKFNFGKDIGDKMTVTDFQDDVDVMVFDWDLFRTKSGGELDAFEFMDKYAQEVGADTVFDFNGGNIVVVQGIGITALTDDISS